MGNHYELGINVKYHGGRFYPHISDQRAQEIWEEWQEHFWAEAAWLASEHGYDECYSEGRMGGWLVVYKGREMVKPSPEFRDAITDLFEEVTSQMEEQYERENADETHIIRGNN